MIHFIFYISADGIGRKLGNDTGVQPQKGYAGKYIDLCTAHLFFKDISPSEPFVSGRREAKEHLP